jgi:dienelactone hydrolase
MRRTPRLSWLTIGLITLLLAAPVSAANPATPTSGTPASQPEPPASGPGSDDTRFPGAHATHYGTDPGGFWIWEPTTGADSATPVAEGPLPVILYLSGCCGNGVWPTPEEVDPWLTHLARQGYVIIAPVYNQMNPLDDSKSRLKEALKELEKPGHAQVDLTKFGAIGYSFGGMQAVHYAADAAAEGLPVPSALFLTAPCVANGFCLDMPTTNLAYPQGMKAIVIGYEDDTVIGLEEPKKVFSLLTTLPVADREFIEMKSDWHGQPPIIAQHETTFQDLNAADWYGIWKLSDALFACALTGDLCEYALGNTPEQRYMGVWSDGVPVTELQVSSEPAKPGATPAP